ncbi:hypothetical protein UA08_02504 [Talaromyces atroroseus]|uniref:Uncharacterized protein n=1 Tax=Talaromyces atroroseus TaxID=1441469 RepID=A0A225B4S7_TALAT|nr:hypothetical protein UA08_02504 [Talaromyces atroroseus]OKL61865.1 hypothetical protein UA08_02504 [Talaromyces atroroseus]
MGTNMNSQLSSPDGRYKESLIPLCKMRIKASGLSIQALLLVRGFGASEYLYRRLCKANPRLLINFSSSKLAPERLTNKIEKHCELQVDLRKVPKKLFEKHTNSDGQSYYKIVYDIAVIPTSGYMLFQLEFNGVSYGSAQADY